MLKDVVILGGCYPNYELKIHKTNCVELPDCTNPVIDSLICYVEKFNEGINPSLIDWDGATNLEKPLCDYWLTGIDNGFANRGATCYTPSYFPFTEFKNISGNKYPYYVGDDGQLRGGFYQTSFKFENYKYQTLPDKYENGWTIELDIYPENMRIENSLNQVFPNNSNFFFYWGLRQENKFTMPLASYYGERTTEGDAINPQLIDLGRINNAYESFNNSYTPNTKKFDVKYEEIINNGFGVRITSENAIQVRYIAKDIINCLPQATINLTSTPNVIKSNEWQRVSITYKPTKVGGCVSETGELRVYVDGFLKLSKNGFPNIKFIGNNEPFSKKIGILHNISVGGGTIGLLETPMVDLPFNIFEQNIVRTYSFSSDISEIKIDGTEYILPNPVTEKELSSLLPQTIGEIKIENGVIFINDTKHVIEHAINSTSDGCLNTIESIVLPHPKYCGIIENNFAGSFIGSVQKFKLYNRKLNSNEIRCNINSNF